ncbi:MAG: DEAD/DEAH box helicase [Gemmatimonadales bacterium]|nr:DEAD/DEAH box helicase [Candidatus Palauibacter denitrificans]
MSQRRMGERPDTEAVLRRLKGFQRDTVEYAFERLYTAPDSTRRFLVADEVGLGKTLVARGLIAKALDHLWEGPNEVDQIDIVYICSNAQIARQNVRRLQIGDGRFVRAARLTLLPREIHGLRANRVNYIALTPGTSFDLKSSMGIREERVLLYHMIQRVWPDFRAGPKNVFQGYVRKTSRFRWELTQFENWYDIDADLADAFADRLRESEGLQETYADLCQRFRRSRAHIPWEDRWRQIEFIGGLRSTLAEVCVDALEPDLVILDEFQRFKDLLVGEHATAQLAKQLFTYSDEASDVRLLLLSATPYKMYTLHHERAEDDHYRDFLRTVEFLDAEPKKSQHLHRLLEDYRQAMYRIESGTENLVRIKEQIEAHLRRVMSRTERLRASEDAEGMMRQIPSTGLELTADDVGDYLTLGEIGREVGQPRVLEYWKAAPYLLSFMDDYKLKTEVVASLDASPENGLEKLLTDGGRVSLPWEEVEAYAQLDPANARLRSLLAWMERGEAWKLLWLPPALPYYAESGPWKAARDQQFSKRLIFSTWAVVPKAVASVVSYDVERRLFQRFDDSIRNTPEERKKRRGLLRFAAAQRRGAGADHPDEKERLTGMPVLGLLYPSPTLVELGDPVAAPARESTLADAVARAQARLEPLLDRLTEPYLDGEREDESWYWAAPILLDLQRHRESTAEWFGRWDLPRIWNGAQEDDEEGSRWVDHVNEARKLVNAGVEAALGGSLDLGRPPDDLADALATRAVAGPATSALRALTRASGSGTASPLAARDAAGRIAWSFRTLFNIPEAMALIRGGRRDHEATPYWRQVVDYCAAGNLQAVLDEYIHTLRDLEGLFAGDDEEAWDKLAEAVTAALSLRTGAPRVDEIQPVDDSVRIQHRRLRNHFAMRFGAQESDDGKTGAREGQVRRAFNSPFWPFVLVSTSVGQEGLDFHAYCHAVMHWNLPSNPVDLEQREGRVHRYKGHAVRKNVATKHGDEVLASGSKDVWHALFEAARDQSTNGVGLVPYWLFPLDDGAYIERHVPALPLSRDASQLEALKRSLAVYRMVFGQPRQDDLMTFLLERCSRERLEEIEPSLRIDLSPRRRERPNI